MIENAADQEIPATRAGVLRKFGKILGLTDEQPSLHNVRHTICTQTDSATQQALSSELNEDLKRVPPYY